MLPCTQAIDLEYAFYFVHLSFIWSCLERAPSFLLSLPSGEDRRAQGRLAGSILELLGPLHTIYACIRFGARFVHLSFHWISFLLTCEGGQRVGEAYDGRDLIIVCEHTSHYRSPQIICIPTSYSFQLISHWSVTGVHFKRPRIGGWGETTRTLVPWRQGWV